MDEYQIVLKIQSPKFGSLWRNSGNCVCAQCLCNIYPLLS